jgi:hypothetical protein
MNTGTELRDELLRHGGATTAGSAADSVERVMRRERRRVRWWAIVTVALWVITAAYLLGLIVFYAVFLHPRFHEFFTAPDIDAEFMKPGMMALFTLLKAVLWWPAILFAAAVSTTLFTLASRRATLRQIQTSLAEISAQLKSLKERE